MILAAGRGERMRPLTDSTPKALLQVGGKPLIQYHIEALVQAGMREIVVNHAWLGDRIVKALGNGHRYGARIRYSPEGWPAMGTGGGILRAMAMLGAQPFLVVNADVWTDFPFASLSAAPRGLAYLVLVDNPPHHPKGDFTLHDGLLQSDGGPKLTFSGIGVYRPALFAGCRPEAFSLGPLLQQAARAGLVTAEHYRGQWHDVGTPQRLRALDKLLREQ